jgi:hypothetical protein
VIPCQFPPVCKVITISEHIQRLLIAPSYPTFLAVPSRKDT